MAKRAEDMATIQAVLDNPNGTKTALAEANPDGDKITPEEKDAGAEQGQKEGKGKGKSDQSDQIRQATQATQDVTMPGTPGGGEAAQQIVQGWKNTFQGIGSDVRGVLERASTPGTILLPLGLLLLFFLILIPINGYPRIAWLWLALTGNASIGPPQESPAPLNTQPPAPTLSAGPNVTQPEAGYVPPAPMQTSYTGAVEEE